MRLSWFVAVLAWASIFVETWLWLLGSIPIDWLHWGFYLLFWFLALAGGAAGLDRISPRRK